MIGADVQPARRWINTSARPFRAAVHAPVEIGTAKAGGSKEAGSDALEAAGGEFRDLRVAVSEVCRGELHFGETLGQLRFGLVKCCNFPGQIAGWGAAHSKWEN